MNQRRSKSVCPSVHTLPALTLAVGLAVCASSARAQPFDFVNITDMPGGPGSGKFPSINDNGDVAFESGFEIYFFDRSENTFVNLMTLPGAPATAWAPRLNINGDVLMMNNATRDLWLYLADSQTFTNISAQPGYPGNTQANGTTTVFDLNNARQVSFHSGDNNFGDIHIYDHAAGAFLQVTSRPGAPSSGRDNKINNIGQVAYGSVGIFGAPVFVYDIGADTTTNINFLPGGPGAGFGPLSFSDSGGVALMLDGGADPVIYDATTSSFLSLATIPGFPAGSGASFFDDLNAEGDFTFWRTNIHHFDADTETFTQLTDIPGETPAGGMHSSINNNGVIAFTAGLIGAEDIFLAIPPCPSDISGDGVTDTADLGLLLGVFGTSDVGADINGDGAVDTADLGALLGEFGSVCP